MNPGVGGARPGPGGAGGAGTLGCWTSADTGVGDVEARSRGHGPATSERAPARQRDRGTPKLRSCCAACWLACLGLSFSFSFSNRGLVLFIGSSTTLHLALGPWFCLALAAAWPAWPGLTRPDLEPAFFLKRCVSIQIGTSNYSLALSLPPRALFVPGPRSSQKMESLGIQVIRKWTK